MYWQPTTSIDYLKDRAKIIRSIRSFFDNRNILEVETPLLSQFSVTDPHVHSITAEFKPTEQTKKKLFLQTSPEYAMKRLLAAGSGSIYQICKAFRAEYSGPIHNPEFTMLEWYRLDYNHHDLMLEADELLQNILKCKPAIKKSYAEFFKLYTNLNPHTAKLHDLRMFSTQNIPLAANLNNKRDYLDLIMNFCIDNNNTQDRPVFIYDFPKELAALAKIHTSSEGQVAARFEIYYQGIEIANGFHELQDANEQLNRFKRDNELRKEFNYPQIPIDENLISALKSGLPNCAGVALGIDRLVMLAQHKNKIREAISFAS